MNLSKLFVFSFEIPSFVKRKRICSHEYFFHLFYSYHIDHIEIVRVFCFKVTQYLLTNEYSSCFPVQTINFHSNNLTRWKSEHEYQQKSQSAGKRTEEVRSYTWLWLFLTRFHIHKARYEFKDKTTLMIHRLLTNKHIH